jgi:hypothetical protein
VSKQIDDTGDAPSGYPQLLVCRKCFRGIGKKGGWKRAAIRAQIQLIAGEAGAAVVKTGCLDVCPEKGVTARLAPSEDEIPNEPFVMEPADEPAATRAKLADAARRSQGGAGGG